MAHKHWRTLNNNAQLFKERQRKIYVVKPTTAAAISSATIVKKG